MLRRLTHTPVASALLVLFFLSLCMSYSGGGGGGNIGVSFVQSQTTADPSRFWLFTACRDPIYHLSGSAKTIFPLELCVTGAVTRFTSAFDFADVSVGTPTAPGDCTGTPTVEETQNLLPIVTVKAIDSVTRKPDGSGGNRTDAVSYWSWALTEVTLALNTWAFVTGYNAKSVGKCVRLNNISTYSAIASRYYNTTQSAEAYARPYTSQSLGPCGNSDVGVVFENATALVDTADASTPSVEACNATVENFSTIVDYWQTDAYDDIFASVYFSKCDPSTQAVVAPAISPIINECVDLRYRFSHCNKEPSAAAACVKFAFYTDASCTVPVTSTDRVVPGASSPFAANAAPQALEVVCNAGGTSISTNFQYYVPYGVQLDCSNAASGQYVLASTCSDAAWTCAETDTMTSGSPCIASTIWPGRYVKKVSDNPSCQTVKLVEYSADGCTGTQTASTLVTTGACDGEGSGLFCPDWNQTAYYPLAFNVNVSDVSKTADQLNTTLTTMLSNFAFGYFTVEAKTIAGQFEVRPSTLNLAAALNSVTKADFTAQGITAIHMQYGVNYFLPLIDEPFLNFNDFIGFGVAGFLFVFTPCMVYVCRKWDEGECCHNDEEDEKDSDDDDDEDDDKKKLSSPTKRKGRRDQSPPNNAGTEMSPVETTANLIPMDDASNNNDVSSNKLDGSQRSQGSIGGAIISIEQLAAVSGAYPSPHAEEGVAADANAEGGGADAANIVPE